MCKRTTHSQKEFPTLIPASDLFDQSVITALLDHDPLVADYRAFFSLLDWSVVERWEAQRSPLGRPAHPESAYLKAFLIRIREGMLYTTQLRRFLLRHPLLVIELGFRLVLDPSAPYGFDVEATLPCEFWLREKLRHCDPALLQALLQATVRALQDEIPGLGEVVAFDVKHIYAWVKENNERTYVPERYDKTKRLAGDPDCRMPRQAQHQPAVARWLDPREKGTHLGRWHRRGGFHRSRVWHRRLSRVHPALPCRRYHLFSSLASAHRPGPGAISHLLSC